MHGVNYCTNINALSKKLTEATRKELYKNWVNEGWDRMMPFEEYVYHLKSAGVEVKEDK